MSVVLSTNDASCARIHIQTRSLTRVPLTSHVPQRKNDPGEEFLEMPASSSTAAAAPMTAEAEEKAEQEYQAIEAKFRAEFAAASS